jgi:hypothetical protein
MNSPRPPRSGLHSTMVLISSIAFALFVVSGVALVLLVGSAAPLRHVIATMLAMALTLTITIHAKNEVRDLTPAPPPRISYRAGRDEEEEYAERAERRDSHQGVRIQPNDEDFSGE